MSASDPPQANLARLTLTPSRASTDSLPRLRLDLNHVGAEFHRAYQFEVANYAPGSAPRAG
jgi:hypothetical protein